ncbi:MAG TPA: hypothetical protein VGF67_26390 [Ktedonobacteraceae bacterium]
MDVGIITAIITAIAAIFVAILGNIFTFLSSKSQIKQNENKTREELKVGLDRFREGWITDLQTTYELEMYKTRLASYPEVFKIIGQLSHGALDPLTPAKAKQVAYALNEWFYSAGGMCADTSTRGALLLLRQVCANWETQGTPIPPADVYTWRNNALLLLRNDLGLRGLESYDFNNTPTLIAKVQAQVARAIQVEHPG